MKVSAVGWAVATLGLVTLLLARLTGWAEMGALGVGSVLVLGAGILMSVGRSQYQVELDVPERRVTVGQPLVGQMTVTNVGRHRTLAAQLVVPVGRGIVNLWLPTLAAGEIHDELLSIPTHRRSAIVAGPVRIRRGDPLYLVSRYRAWTQSLEILVHPQVVSLAVSRAGYLRDLEGQTTADLSDSDLSFHALRDYVPGDDRRLIHWRSSARKGLLLVRQFEDTRRTRTTVALANHSDEYASEAEFELAVSVAASLALHVVHEERELSFLVGTQRLAAGTPVTILDSCARLEVDPHGVTAAQMPQRVALEPATSSVAFLVQGSATSLTEQRTAASRTPNGLRVVVISCRLAEPTVVQKRGHVTVTSLGELNELPQLLRRVVR